MRSMSAGRTFPVFILSVLILMPQSYKNVAENFCRSVQNLNDFSNRTAASSIPASDGA